MWITGSAPVPCGTSRPPVQRWNLEEHGGRTFEGAAVRVAQRVLAMAAGFWHNNKIGAPGDRSPDAYDH